MKKLVTDDGFLKDYINLFHSNLDYLYSHCDELSSKKLVVITEEDFDKLQDDSRSLSRLQRSYKEFFRNFGSL